MSALQFNDMFVFMWTIDWPRRSLWDSSIMMLSIVSLLAPNANMSNLSQSLIIISTQRTSAGGGGADVFTHFN